MADESTKKKRGKPWTLAYRQEYLRRYYQAHREKMLARQAENGKTYREKLKKSKPRPQPVLKTTWTRSEFMRLTPPKVVRLVSAIIQGQCVLT